MVREDERARVRVEVRRQLRLLVEEAKLQGCLAEARQFLGVFATFAVLDPVIGEAVGREMVTLDDLMLWLAVLLSQA